jgi:hypothetical protein
MSSKTLEISGNASALAHQAILPVPQANFVKLMLCLYQNRTPRIKVKRIDRLNYGNFATVVRCSSALILLREDETGIAEVLPDFKYVTHFILENAVQRYEANTEYPII